MRKDRRNAKVRFLCKEGRHFLCYKGKKCQLGMGSSDFVEIFRYGNDFFLLEYNERLGYIGFELVSKDMELLQDLFIQNVDEFSEELNLKQHLFDYAKPFQADILSQWIE